MIRTRRSFLYGALPLLAAPAIVHVANIMPVKAIVQLDDAGVALLSTAHPLGGWICAADLISLEMLYMGYALYEASLEVLHMDMRCMKQLGKL